MQTRWCLMSHLLLGIFIIYILPESYGNFITSESSDSYNQIKRPGYVGGLELVGTSA